MIEIDVATAAALRGLKRLNDNLARRSADGLKDAGLVVLTAAKENIERGRSDWPAVKRPDLRRSVISRSQTTPLLDTGHLMRDIHMEAEPEVVVVGNSVKYAPVHEFGQAIDVTAKMRAYLHHRGLHLKKTTTQVHIPKRPYLTPAVEENVERIQQAFIRALTESPLI